MKTVKAGDKLAVESINRFAHNTRDLLNLVWLSEKMLK
jgi:DNA invertase Pin-like site-specific DNA recombinase